MHYLYHHVPITRLMHISKHYDFMFDLVSATVAEITGWCTIEVIDIERAAVSHLNVGGPAATV